MCNAMPGIHLSSTWGYTIYRNGWINLAAVSSLRTRAYFSAYSTLSCKGIRVLSIIRARPSGFLSTFLLFLSWHVDSRKIIMSVVNFFPLMQVLHSERPRLFTTLEPRGIFYWQTNIFTIVMAFISLMYLMLYFVSFPSHLLSLWIFDSSVRFLTGVHGV